MEQMILDTVGNAYYLTQDMLFDITNKIEILGYGMIAGMAAIGILQIVCLWKLHKLDKRLKKKDESPYPSE